MPRSRYTRARIASRVGGPVGMSIARTSNFTFESTEEMKLVGEGKSSAYIYTRYGNPTLTIAEEKIAALEGAEAAVVTASGSRSDIERAAGGAASGRRSDRHAPALRRKLRLMRDIFPRYGIVVRYVDTDLQGIERTGESANEGALRGDADQSHAAAGGSAKGGRVREGMGSDFDGGQHVREARCCKSRLRWDSIWCCTARSKYLAGHSDVIAGAAAGSEGLIRQVRQNVINLGGSMDPEAAFLLIRGMKTLDLRVERQCEIGDEGGEISGESILKSRGCIIRGWLRIPITSWQSARCAGSARCWRST